MGESVVRLVLGGEGNPESITDVMCNGSSTAEFCLQIICPYEATVALSKQYIMSEDLVKKCWPLSSFPAMHADCRNET